MKLLKTLHSAAGIFQMRHVSIWSLYCILTWIGSHKCGHFKRHVATGRSLEWKNEVYNLKRRGRGKKSQRGAPYTWEDRKGTSWLQSALKCCKRSSFLFSCCMGQEIMCLNCWKIQVKHYQNKLPSSSTLKHFTGKPLGSSLLKILSPVSFRLSKYSWHYLVRRPDQPVS